MDTISSDSNGSSSYLPVAALIVGLLAGVLAVVALAKVSSANKQLEAQAALAPRVDGIEQQVRSAVTTAEQASQRVSKVASETQSAFNQVGEVMTQLRADMQKAQEARPAPAAATAKNAAPAVAGPGEYVVKGGDTGARIARAQGVTLPDLMSVNPGVDWNRLHVGQKIKLPQK